MGVRVSYAPNAARPFSCHPALQDGCGAMRVAQSETLPVVFLLIESRLGRRQSLLLLS